MDFSCPACGFLIYNRRHAKCERCKAALPACLLLSEQERVQLLETEREQVELEPERAQVRSARDAVPGPEAHALPTYSPASHSARGGEPAASGDRGAPGTWTDTFTSGGGGGFDGGGASDSFGGDGGGSSGGDGGC